MDEFRNVASQSRTHEGRYEGHYSRKKPTKRKYKRNKKMFLIVIILLVIIVATISIFVFGGSSNSELLGVWRYDQYTEYEFSEKGQGCLCVDDVHYEYRYKVSGNTIKLDFVDDVVRDCEYTFSVEGKSLTLIGGEGTDKGTYKLSKQ